MFQNIQLEVSLKPFKQIDDAYIRKVCRGIFEQWKALVKDAPTVSVMLWTADGSEILDYKGNLDEPFEWAYLVGGANPVEDRHPDADPEGIGLHTRNYLYMKNPPVMTYGVLKKIVAELHRAGKEVLGEDKNILVGETFDVGPEFAKSSFKYKRHNEICLSDTMGAKSFVCSYATLHADDVPYAGFPNGIPEGLPFGTFFGRQSQHFLSDLGFDFMWFSNGLGFGRDTWHTTGATFDGQKFNTDEMEEVKRIVLEFWDLYTAECSFPIQTRGTNMSMGIDMSTDAVPLRAIYKNNPDMLPPPNSPWAALDGDYGLELMGYMSRIAEFPKDRYLFRFYVHDPWWANSPWYDRYGGLPHDIYLPLACARIDENGVVQKPTDLSLLSIDNCFGELPDSCANEPIPHLLKGYKDAPDAPSPFVWVYPFREYNDADTTQLLNEMFAEDWFIRGAINNCFPLSSVTSTDSFLKQDLSIYGCSVLVTPVPFAGSAFESKILEYAKNGGKVIFYGRADRASDAFRAYVNIKLTADELDGELPITVNGADAGILKVNALTSAGKLNTELLDANGEAQPFAIAGGKVLATASKNVVWLRATVSADYTGASLLRPHDRTKYFLSETLMTEAACLFGWDIVNIRRFADSKSPMMMVCRSDNAFMFSTFSDDISVETHLRTPFGAPAFIGHDTVLENGVSILHMAKSTHMEGRVFVDQPEGRIVVREMTPVSYHMRRRIKVTGLKDATVRFFSENYCKDNTNIVVNTNHGGEACVLSEPYEGGLVQSEVGTYYELRHVTGEVIFSMPRRDIFEQ